MPVAVVRAVHEGDRGGGSGTGPDAAGAGGDDVAARAPAGVDVASGSAAVVAGCTPSVDAAGAAGAPEGVGGGHDDLRGGCIQHRRDASGC